jgi:hypothetical protein
MSAFAKKFQPTIKDVLASLPGDSKGEKLPDFYSRDHPWITQALGEMAEDTPVLNEGFVIQTQVCVIGGAYGGFCNFTPDLGYFSFLSYSKKLHMKTISTFELRYRHNISQYNFYNFILHADPVSCCFLKVTVYSFSFTSDD